MPGFDGTGPRGVGPMTGGGRGFCAVPGYGLMPGYGAGYGWSARGGRGRGLGRGMRRGMGRGMAYPYAPFIVAGPPYLLHPYGTAGFGPEQELDMLKGQADMLKQQMEQISNRINELKKSDTE